MITDQKEARGGDPFEVTPENYYEDTVVPIMRRLYPVAVRYDDNLRIDIDHIRNKAYSYLQFHTEEERELAISLFEVPLRVVSVGSADASRYIHTHMPISTDREKEIVQRYVKIMGDMVSIISMAPLAPIGVAPARQRLDYVENKNAPNMSHNRPDEKKEPEPRQRLKN